MPFPTPMNAEQMIDFLVVCLFIITCYILDFALTEVIKIWREK